MKVPPLGHGSTPYRGHFRLQRRCAMNQYFACACCVLIAGSFSSSQQNPYRQSNLDLDGALVRMDSQGKTPIEIRFPERRCVPVASFFEWYRRAFDWPPENDARLLKTSTDQLGQTHHRFGQSYKGIELAEVQYLVHEKDGLVFLAHGRLVHGLSVDVTPRLSEHEALQHALHHINADSYMWENPRSAAPLKAGLHDPAATYYPRGELKLSAGNQEPVAQNFRLVYRFDIFAQKPFRRDYVDVDANTGEVIKTLSRVQYGDVQGWGQSLYNGMVPITVSDADYPTLPLLPSRWHLDTWNAYGGSGQSWWMADPTLGNSGGYDDSWCEALDTDPITINGVNPVLTFLHRYSVESPSAYEVYDGWDGMNVRISVDGGSTWSILTDPMPAYTCTSLYSFKAEGPGVPGWAGQLDNWTQVTFDLSSYSGKTVQLRFAIASDESLSTPNIPELFGWQIDEVLILSSSGVLYGNNGSPMGMTAKNIYQEVVTIDGNYRLRERGRGNGIATYNALNGWIQVTSVDFVDEDSVFTDAEDRPGVSAHWALEACYDYFLTTNGRNSYDGSGARIISYANYVFLYSDGTIDPNAAAWDGARIYFGGGDGSLRRPLVSLDIAGHELTHGVTQFAAGLTYVNEPGALNESFSDIFGAMVEFSKEAGSGDWLIGEDMTISGTGSGSLADPKSVGDPDTYLGEFWISPSPAPERQNDWGGVHTNCGVQNHWFYLLSEGGSGINDNGDSYAVTGIGKDKAAQIAYRNLTVYLMPASGYADARWGAIHAAIDLFGPNSPEVQSVIDAWYAVGVLRSYVAPYPQSCMLSACYLAPGKDTLLVNVQLVNPEKQSIDMQAIIESTELTVSDTIAMYDDGMHQDSSAGDGIYGGHWPARSDEKHYSVHIKTSSPGSNYYDIAQKMGLFTTVGPIVLDLLRIDRPVVRPGDRFQVMLTLGNRGRDTVAKQITARFSRLDTCCIVPSYSLAFGDIAAGDTTAHPVVRPMQILKTCRGGHAVFAELLISSNNIQYWRDTFSVFVDTLLTGVDVAAEALPVEHSLSQNYPNPFNPSTTIRYELPRASHVTLTVFDLLGREVATLVQGLQEPGYKSVEWNATGVASGVYFYRLTAGDFVRTCKLLLLR